jgi:hypothetical protein
LLRRWCASPHPIGEWWVRRPSFQPMNLPELSMAVLVVLMLTWLVFVVGRVSRASAWKLGLGLGVWLAVTAVLAVSGVFEHWEARPPRLFLLPATALVSMVLLSRTRALREVLTATPPTWLLLVQGYRVPVELILFALFTAGRAPVQITFEGRNFDILVGLTAPVMAWLVHRARVSPAVVVAWNVLGFGVLLNTIGVVATSLPGPLRADWPGAPLTVVATWPMVWLPAFLAPLALFLHVNSLRQQVPLLNRARRAAA